MLETRILLILFMLFYFVSKNEQKQGFVHSWRDISP